MADEELRLHQRAARAGDPAAVEAAIAALRRTGQRVPEALLDARRLPPTTFTSPLRLDVRAVVPARDPVPLGRTPTQYDRPLDVPEHAALHVAARPSTEDEALEVAREVARLGVPRLRLSLPDGRRLSTVLDALAACALTHLEVAAGGRELGTTGHERLAGLGLVALELQGNGARRGAARLASARGLERLRYTDSTIGHDTLACLVSVDVEVLELRATSTLQRALPPKLLRALGDRPRLRALRLQGPLELTDRGLEALGGLGGLRELLLPDPLQLTGAAFAPLARLPLEALSFGVGPGLLGQVAALPLTTLRCAPWYVPRRDELGALPTGLTDLGLAVDAAPAWLERLPALQRLWLMLSGDLGVDGLAPLVALPRLETLTLVLDRAAVLDAPRLAPLARLDGLRALAVVFGRQATTELDAAAGRALAALAGLRHLALRGDGVTDAALVALAAHPTLEELELHLGREGDGAGLEALVAGLPALRRLQVGRDRGMAPYALERFARTHPACVVIHDDRGEHRRVFA